jgi:hypothetical protein
LIGLNINLSLKEEKDSLILYIQNALSNSSDYEYNVDIKTNKKISPGNITVQSPGEINLRSWRTGEIIKINEIGNMSLSCTLPKKSSKWLK